MDFTYEFNRPRMLREYLGQALHQVLFPRSEEGMKPEVKKRLEGTERYLTERIVVGDKGGLAYALFREDDSKLFSSLPLQREANLDPIKELSDIIKQYKITAGNIARGSGFDIVAQERQRHDAHNWNFSLVNDYRSDSSPLTSMAIGGRVIESVERVENFVTMVREHYQRLDEWLADVVKKRGKVF